MNEIKKKVANLTEAKAKEMLLNVIKHGYTPVGWPEVQNYMEKKWFKKEAILDTDSLVNGLSSTYLIPTKRFINE